MPADCSPALLEFPPVAGRRVEGDHQDLLCGRPRKLQAVFRLLLWRDG